LDATILTIFLVVYVGMILGKVPGLALAGTLAGNLFIVGSIANIIVVEQASRLGVSITWRDHLRVGLPVTAATLAIAAGWLFLRFV